MRAPKMLKKVAMLPATVALYVIIPTPSVESHIWNPEGQN